MANPARARAEGEVEDRRALVDAVSAASSEDRRESWVLVKAWMSTGLGAIVKIYGGGDV